MWKSAMSGTGCDRTSVTVLTRRYSAEMQIGKIADYPLVRPVEEETCSCILGIQESLGPDEAIADY